MEQSNDSSLNPLKTPLREAESVVENLVRALSAVKAELQWFHSTNRDAVSDRLTAAERTLIALNTDINAKTAQLTACQRELDDIALSIRTLLNPRNWFDADQRRFRRLRKQLLADHREIESARTHLAAHAKETQGRIDSTSEVIRRYDSFDLPERKVVEADLNQQIASARASRDRLLARKLGVDQALEPVVKQILDVENRMKQAENARKRARQLDDELSSASNPYERAMIHKDCEGEFDTGSPRKIVGQKDRELSRLERDLEKLRKRAFDIAERAMRTITTVVIDGNNLCYDNNRFIGTVVLDTIVPILDSDYRTIVVFDASIRRMLKVDDNRIQGRFPRTTQVHIVSTSNKADETVLDLAGMDSNTYILSNDRFGEFNDKSAVQENRLIRHEIVDGRIFVHDLGINATYNAKDG